MNQDHDQDITLHTTRGCNIFALFVHLLLSKRNGQTYGPEIWHGGQVEGYLVKFVGLSQRLCIFIDLLHCFFLTISISF